MSIDLTQFYPVFYEESYEGLDTMESALLNLDVDHVDHVDPEAINEIFRAVHSMKGGSSTFGFSGIADFTHVIETLLDEIRSEARIITVEYVELLLKCVDCIRRMLQQMERGESSDLPETLELNARLVTLLKNNKPEPSPSLEPALDAAKKTKGWKIYFKPDKDVLKTGNEPLRMFRELAEKGELTVECKAQDLPKIGAIDPECCYLSWNLLLMGDDISEESVQEVFEWVVDEAILEVTALGEDKVQPSPNVKAKSEGSSIRVGIDKVDNLINMVGELVITQSMLSELGCNFNMDLVPRLLEGLDQLSQNTRELQESVMRIRMLPISFTFSRFPRLVHDISHDMGKKIELKLQGEQTELDKTVMEKIGDPLVHLVRNSLDHGIETPDVRRALGKPEQGTIILSAFHQGGNIVIQVIDDGQGINKRQVLDKAIEKGLVSEEEALTDDQINDLIFRPGFSTAEVVTDISGRGVGMDVVKRNITELNGSIEMVSVEGEGSKFTIRLPLTLAILEGQLIQIGENVYILPLISIVESIQDFEGMIHRVAGSYDVLRLRNEYIPIIGLSDIFHVDASRDIMENGLLVVVESDNMKVAILVDDLLAQQQVVIKSLEDNYRKVEGVSGATILGNGAISLILDIAGLIKLAGVKKEGYKRLKSENGQAA